MLQCVVDEMAGGGTDQQEEAAGADDPSQEDVNPPSKKARNESLQDMYQEILAENDVQQAATGVTASQVQTYLAEITILKTACPLMYWNSNRTRFPALARVARKYLTAPCTSVDSERLFSAVSHVIDEKRNRIHCDNAEMLIFIQKNLPLLH
ncbi:zinc finger BED domain-containing protein 4-like [Fundulus heteroclitus]|uniref:zinc finger BED domain-containing protein 4-like n=1 Tax=Fundulus heteroclitus TaxID=8078 RepID=UPI00165BFA31|nr:zinc finger BED domain-containing protein 4-like [Fundulus heteroclitus]